MTKTTGLRRRSAVLGAAGTLALHSVHALAQGDRTIKLILPVTAGSGIDNIVRAAQPALGRALGLWGDDLDFLAATTAAAPDTGNVGWDNRTHTLILHSKGMLFSLVISALVAAVAIQALSGSVMSWMSAVEMSTP